MKKSSLIYVPKNVPHAPIIFKDIKEPVLCFTIGTAPKWTQTGKKAGDKAKPLFRNKSKK
jgi:uncharacterized RmlC-like cupin family protein